MTRERAILGFLDELEGRGMHGFVLSLRGQVIARGDWAPFRSDDMHRMYSVSKSVVSLAIGMLADEGKIALDDRIVGYFPEWTDDSTPALLRGVTIRHMLTMSTCYDRSTYAPLRDGNWAKTFFSGQASHPAGTLFHYDTSASQVMCALVEKLTGERILSFMQRRLFDRIGMNGPKKWLSDASGTSQGGTGLLMTLDDYAKLADFCMSDGRGIVSEGYLRAATGWQIATDERTAPEERYGYGYQFWRMREGFYMYGLGGQMALCLPDKQLALCTTADMMLSSTAVQPIFDAFFRWLADIDVLPCDAQDAQALRERIAGLRVEPLGGEAKDGTMHIALERSELPFDALTIAPDAVTFRIGGQAYALPCGCGEWKRGVFPQSDIPCITSGGWVSESRFLLHSELVGDFVCGMEIYLTVNGNSAALRVHGALWECVAGWSGLAWGRVTQ